MRDTAPGGSSFRKVKKREHKWETRLLADQDSESLKKVVEMRKNRKIP